jgi:hypothetical protein
MNMMPLRGLPFGVRLNARLGADFNAVDICFDLCSPDASFG